MCTIQPEIITIVQKQGCINVSQVHNYIVKILELTQTEIYAALTAKSVLRTRPGPKFVFLQYDLTHLKTVNEVQFGLFFG